MKYVPIKKQKSKKRIFIEEGIRTSLPKPKLPRTMFWKTHKIENVYLGWK